MSIWANIVDLNPPIDSAVDLKQSEARLEGGLLTISLPRLKDRRGQRTSIPIRRSEE